MPARTDNSRWRLAAAICDDAVERYGGQVHAVGIHGSLAHGDDDEFSDIDLVIVTNQENQGPPTRSRVIDGVIVDVGVVSAAEYLEEASSIRRNWPLAGTSTW